MKTGQILISACITIFILASFASNQYKSQEELMEEYIAEKIEEVRRNEWEKCYYEVIKKAESYVDSIIYKKVNFSINDTLKTPAKPLKPLRPFDTLILDTTIVKPILGDTIPRN